MEGSLIKIRDQTVPLIACPLDRVPLIVRVFIVGHHDLDPKKACPVYDVVSEYADLQPK